MGFIIGIDCGATGTDVVLFNKIPGRKTHTRFGAINYNLLGLENTVKQLRSIIKKLIGNSFINSGCIVIGISGARNQTDRNKICKLLQKSLNFKNICIYPDTEIALSAAFDGNKKNCGILIAGTGSVLYYNDSREQTKRIGGWGRHIGDEGGGYWIAKNALYKVTQHYDSRAGQTLLAEKLRKKLKISPGNIIKQVYHNNFEISRVTALVFECAESGDKICRQIIMEAAEHLKNHFIPLKRKKIKIALCGSLFTKEKLLEKYFRKIMKLNYPGIKLVKPLAEPVWGAVKIGLKYQK